MDAGLCWVVFLEARCASWGRVYRPRMPVHVGLSFRAGEPTAAATDMIRENGTLAES